MTVLYERTTPNQGVARRVETENKSHVHSLARAVVTAARQVDASMLTPMDGCHLNLAFEPRTLLALLTFCYARQIYGSSEIAALFCADLNFRRLCGDEIPDAPMLRLFRRENRPALDVCLRTALRLAAEEKIAQGLLTRVNEERLAEEVRRRITMAAFIDNMEPDKDRNGTGPPAPHLEKTVPHYSTFPRCPGMF